MKAKVPVNAGKLKVRIAPIALENPSNNTNNSGSQPKEAKRAEGQWQNRFYTAPHPRWRLPRDWW